MKQTIFTLLAILLICQGCTKKEPTRTSGIDTIDNQIYFSTTYYAYGFSFSEAKLISTSGNPGPDIVLYVNSEFLPGRLTIQANNLKSSFFKSGDFSDVATAKSAFDNLKTVSVSQSQWMEMADPVKDNQVWIYKSGTDTYAKFRIVSTINETRESLPYGECKFEWVYQPDGSLTFP